MLAVGTHARVATAKRQREECEQQEGSTSSSSSTSCDEVMLRPPPPRLCDTTDEIAEIALNATLSGKYSDWVPSLSYMDLRNMQEATGFIENQNNVWRCLRSAEIYDSISCPVGYLKKSELDVSTGCTQAGLECEDGYQCICSPCYKPLECVDSVNVSGRCVPYNIFLPALLVPIAILFIVLCFTALGVKSKQMVSQAKQAAKNERDLNEFIA